MSTAPLRSQVLRGAAVPPLASHRLDPVEALAHGLDGRPIADDLRRARQAATERGHAEGYAAGYAQGRAEGQASAQAEAEAAYASCLVPALAAVEAARSALEERDAVALAEIERAVVALAVDIAESILQRELADRSAASEALRRALSLVPARGEVIARLHPDDLTTVVEHGVGLPGREVALVADPAVERGGAVVEVGPCRIDAQVGPALGRVRSALGVALDGEVAS